MKRSATQFSKQKKSLRTLAGYGKSWEPGSQNRVFFPIFWDEEEGAYTVLAAGCWGHNTDFDRFPLKTSFIRTNSEVDEYGKPIGVPDVAYQFSRIARIFVEGEHILEKKKIENSKLSDTAKIEKYAEISKKYNPKEQSSVKPVVRGLDLKVATEVAVVPLKDSVPDISKMDIYSLDLSQKKIDNINKILRDPKYKPAGTDATYIEVEYTYAMGEKKTVGQAEAAGITEQYKIKTQFPEEWEKIEKSLLPSLPQESEEIELRNFSFRKVNNSEVAKAISDYMCLNAELLTTAVAEEKQAEILVTNSAILKKLDLVRLVEDDDIVARIEAELNEEEVITDTNSEVKFDAPTVSDLIKNNSEKLPTDEEIESSYEVAV